jgi:hypothetical protein
MLIVAHKVLESILTVNSHNWGVIDIQNNNYKKEVEILYIPA